LLDTTIGDGKKGGVVANGINKKRAIPILDEQGEEQMLLGINKIAKTYSLGNVA
jgi:hypothetical protein